jgi:hypothetical protein
MEKEITIEYTPNIEALMKVSKYLILRIRFVKFIPIVLLFLLYPTVLKAFGVGLGLKEENSLLSDLLPIIVVIGIWVGLYFNMLSTMKKNILNNKRNFETQKIVFNTTSYTQGATTFKVENFWSETYQIKETQDWFLIYPRKNTAFPITKTDLKDNQYKELKELFNSLNIKKSLK